MRYEHLVAVNDSTGQSGVCLTRQQLWQGLMLRVESPELFIPGVEQVTLQEKTELHILREMQLGVLQVRDRIHLQPNLQIHFETEPGEQHQGGQLILTIEEPEPASLFVRFCYETPVSGTTPEEMHYESYLKEMWRQMDVECIRIIRSLAESGQLLHPTH